MAVGIWPVREMNGDCLVGATDGQPKCVLPSCSYDSFGNLTQMCLLAFSLVGNFE